MTLDEIPEIADDLWMLSTGTAVGPFISMLESMQIQEQNGSESEKAASFKNLVLVHAVRTEQDLTYRDRITQLVDHFQGNLNMCQLFLENQSPELCADESQACYLEATLSKPRLSLSIRPAVFSTLWQSANGS